MSIFNSDQSQEDAGTTTVEKTEVVTSKYPMFKVIMHNDDKTTFDFVISVLMKIYSKKAQDAENLAASIHKSGSALVGVYMFETAELKVDQTHSAARTQGFPLKCTIESA